MNRRALAAFVVLPLAVIACGSPVPAASSPHAQMSSTAAPPPSPEPEICVGREQALGWDLAPPIVRRLGEAWMAPNQSTTLAILEEIWAEDGVYVNAFDEKPVVGRQALAEYMAFGMAENYLEITDWQPIYLHNDRVQIRWRDCCPNGTILLTGTEYGEFDSAGLFSRVTSFWDHYVEEAAAAACG